MLKVSRWLLVLWLASVAAAVSGQQPTFKVQTTAIEVDVVVTDRDGNIVQGLTKNDFTVLDDGKPQEISTFTFVDIPIERADLGDTSGRGAPSGAALVESDVRSNKPFDGRVYILVLDDLHTTPEWSLQVRKAARLFIEDRLGDNDLMAVVYTSGRRDAGQDFTSSRTLLIAAVEAFTGRKPLAQSAGASLDPSASAGGGAGQGASGRGGLGVGASANPLQWTVRMERESDADRMLGLIRRIADWGDQTLPGRRKALLLFSEGVDGFTASDFGGADFVDANQAEFRRINADTIVDEKVRDAIAASTRANLSIFPVDARGLDNLSITNGHLALTAMADETGGEAVLRSNNLAAGFARIVRDISSYYAIAYLAPSPYRSGTTHRIAVRVDRPGVEVRTRNGYVLPDSRPRAEPAAQPVRVNAISADLNTAINNPLPTAGLRLAVFAAPFKGKGRTSSVLVGVEIDNLALARQDASGRLRDEVELTAVVTGLSDFKGGRVDHVHVRVTPETARRTGGAVRVLHRLDLPPGKYQLRVAAKDGNSGRVGSLAYDLEVPDLTNKKTPLVLSGVLLTSARAIELTTTGDREPLVAALGAAPAARREFSRDDELVVFAEVYDTDKTPHRTIVTTRVLDLTGRTAFELIDPVPGVSQGGRSEVWGHRARLRLSDLRPGRYVLQLEARSQTAPERIVTREIPFTVTSQ